MSTLSEACAEYVKENTPLFSDACTSRAYMAGALEVLTQLRRGASSEALLSECVQFGRVIGTAAERAHN